MIMEPGSHLGPGCHVGGPEDPGQFAGRHVMGRLITPGDTDLGQGKHVMERLVTPGQPDPGQTLVGTDTAPDTSVLTFDPDGQLVGGTLEKLPTPPADSQGHFHPAHAVPGQPTDTGLGYGPDGELMWFGDPSKAPVVPGGGVVIGPDGRLIITKPDQKVPAQHGDGSGLYVGPDGHIHWRGRPAEAPIKSGANLGIGSDGTLLGFGVVNKAPLQLEKARSIKVVPPADTIPPGNGQPHYKSTGPGSGQSEGAGGQGQGIRAQAPFAPGQGGGSGDGSGSGSGSGSGNGSGNGSGSGSGSGLGGSGSGLGGSGSGTGGAGTDKKARAHLPPVNAAGGGQLTFDKNRYRQLTDTMNLMTLGLIWDATSTPDMQLDSEFLVQPPNQKWQPAMDVNRWSKDLGQSVFTQNDKLDKRMQVFTNALVAAADVFSDTDDLANYDITLFVSQYPDLGSGAAASGGPSA